VDKVPSRDTPSLNLADHRKGVFAYFAHSALAFRSIPPSVTGSLSPI
jgi:hypothetical protein